MNTYIDGISKTGEMNGEKIYNKVVGLIKDNSYSKQNLWKAFYEFLSSGDKVGHIFLYEFPSVHLTDMTIDHLPREGTPLREILDNIYDTFHTTSGPNINVSNDFGERVDNAIIKNNTDMSALCPKKENISELHKSIKKEYIKLGKDNNGKHTGIVEKVNERIRSDRKKKKKKIIRDVMILYMYRNRNHSTSAQLILSGTNVEEHRKKLKDMKDLSSSDTQLLDINKEIEKEFAKIQSKEARKDGKIVAVLDTVGNIALVAGIIVGGTKVEPTGSYNSGAKIMNDIGHTVGIEMGVLDNNGELESQRLKEGAEVGKKLVEIGGDLMAQAYKQIDIPNFDVGLILDYLGDAMNTVHPNAINFGTMVGFFAMGVSIKALTKKIKNSKITLSLKEKEQVKYYTNKWAILSIIIGASPLISFLGIDKLLPIIQGLIDQLSEL